MLTFAKLPALTVTRLILVSALVFTLLYNQAFFRNTLAIYGTEPSGLLFIASLALFLFGTNVLVLSCLCFRYLTKPVLIMVVLGAAAANYFMSRFNIVVDTTMVTNILLTDSREVSDLFSLSLILQLVLLGVLPALIIWRTPVFCGSFQREMWQRAKLAIAAVLLIVISVLPFTGYYTGFFREHKLLRYYANPATFIYSSGKLVDMALGQSADVPRTEIGLDAHIPPTDIDRELIILVVGEAVRADHFGLNGYTRQTTPRLDEEDVISYRHVLSCGTATAYSLPCMFSVDDRSSFELEDAARKENLLDVLKHAGVSVLWRDNNSDSKGVAQSIEFEDFRTPQSNPDCMDECRDIGMLAGLAEYIETHPNGDLTIVLHQMGNHGPAYYRRYPAAFEHYTPACHTSELARCTDAEIVNAYDNAILYTDFFLGEVINFLKEYDDRFETAMYYMSDHGESLGESGLYLHGLPWLLAPMNQKHVASVLWFGSAYEADARAIASGAEAEISHDNYFHTVLGLLEINTDLYDPQMDLIIHSHN